MKCCYYFKYKNEIDILSNQMTTFSNKKGVSFPVLEYENYSDGRYRIINIDGICYQCLLDDLIRMYNDIDIYIDSEEEFENIEDIKFLYRKNIDFIYNLCIDKYNKKQETK